MIGMMQARVKLLERLTFVGVARGRGIVIDAPSEHGGEGIGPSPMELVLIGTAACTAFDVVEILRKSGQRVERFEVRATAERAPKPPRVFTKVHLEYVVEGEVDEKVLEDAIRLSMQRYCSASIMIKRSGAEVTTSYHIIRTSKS